MNRQTRVQNATFMLQLSTLACLLLVSNTSRAVDVHISPRFWYAIENLNTARASEILDRDNQTVTHIDQDTIPLVGASILVEAELDFLASFFWGSSTADFIFFSRRQKATPIDDFQSFGEVKTDRYDAEILLRWRPKDRSIYLVSGLRYYHLKYVLKSDETTLIPPLELGFPLPGIDQSLHPFPNQEFINDMILWEIGGGLYTSITADAKHRMIGGALIGLGYSHFTQKGKSGQFFADEALFPLVEYPKVKTSRDRFALIWDVNVGYQWQFHPKLNFVARYRAFGKPGSAADSTQMIFIVSHGPEIGVGYSF